MIFKCRVCPDDKGLSVARSHINALNKACISNRPSANIWGKVPSRVKDGTRDVQLEANELNRTPDRE
jgi:hypothetical protein